MLIKRGSEKHFTQGGSTVNLAALDISKAFDRVDYFGLFLKIMNRRVSNVLLNTLENCFNKCYTWVRRYYRLTCAQPAITLEEDIIWYYGFLQGVISNLSGIRPSYPA